MLIAPLRPDQKDLWIALRQDLWPETGALTHHREGRALLERPERAAVFLAWPDAAAERSGQGAAAGWGALWPGADLAQSWAQEWSKAWGETWGQTWSQALGGVPGAPVFWPAPFGGGPKPLGFAEARLREDPDAAADGALLPFLEGIYVAPEHRRTGIARALIAAVEAWAKALGHDRLGSDALLANEAGRALHEATGFQEVERLVRYRKRLR